MDRQNIVPEPSAPAEEVSQDFERESTEQSSGDTDGVPSCQRGNE